MVSRKAALFKPVHANLLQNTVNLLGDILRVNEVILENKVAEFDRSWQTLAVLQR